MEDYRCPCAAHSELARGDGNYVCSRCNLQFPLVNGIPILLDESNSVFAINDYLGGSSYQGASHDHSATGFRQFYRQFARAIMDSQPKRRGFDSNSAISYVCDRASSAPRILVIGAGYASYEADAEIVYTDVSFGNRVQCICDAHGLPFPESYFDLILAVAVLEHVADPYRCLHEIHRVLKPDGFVYSATPFLQPVHMGAYDFTRFTPLGHRRLHRWFDEITSGIALGPGAVLAWSIRYYILSLSDNGRYRRIARLAGAVLTLPLRWSDLLFRGKIGAWDMAGGAYFFGQRRLSPIPDREILKSYRGRDA